MDLSKSIYELPGTAIRTKKQLEKLEVKTYEDLLYYLPFRYDDFSKIAKISTLQEGETVTIKGKLISFKESFTKNKFRLQKGIIADDTGSIEIVWYNQSYLSKVLFEGSYVSVAGSIERFAGKLNMKPQEYEVLKSETDKTVHTGRLVPVYSQTYGLSSKTISNKIQYVLNLIRDKNEDLEYIPKDILDKFKLTDEGNAIFKIHAPESEKDYLLARKRLGFNELFIRVLSSKLVKKEWDSIKIVKPIKISKDVEKKINEFIGSLPFQLTTSQKNVIDDIFSDLQKSSPMNRFLQGDVGSGKTVVAAVAAYLTHLNGLKTLIMAPTTVLASQHFETIKKMFQDFDLKIGIQTGSRKSVSKKEKSMEFDILVGTQALISKNINFGEVGLVIIDEQHRFGVKQRAMLKNKGINPHLLTMTATPIPRTVSLTLYSELDLSVIDEMPKGRKPIKTYVTPQVKKEKGYEWIKKQIKANGDQVYIICPLIEESESETMKSVRAATKEYEYLKNEVFTEFNIALLHGKMKVKEKEEVMQKFKNKEFDILISTSVVEVGVDVPDATIMLIEGAERFGIAQLHQLRGRVGRSDKQSYCFLFTSNKQAEKSSRLKFFASTNSGMKLAEYDLKIRGPGNLYGKEQHGYADLKIADISDISQVKQAKDAVSIFTKNYKIKDIQKIKEKIERFELNQISRD